MKDHIYHQIRRFTLLGGTGAMLALPSPAQNLLTNGDFENEPNWGNNQVDYDGNATAMVGSEIPGWTIEPNHAATIQTTAAPYDYLTIRGTYSLNTDGEGYDGHNADLYQDFTSQLGTPYALTFNWQSWNIATPTNTQLEVSLVDNVTSDVLYDGLYAYDLGGPYPVHTVSTNFLGTGDSLRLRIQQSPESGYNDDMFVVDNFSVTVATNVGALLVTITPPDAVNAGAEWQVDGGTYEASGAVVTNLPVGNHTISFSTLPGWATPMNQTVSVSGTGTNSGSGTYSALSPSQFTYIWAHNALGQEFQHCNDLYPQYYPSNSSWTQSYTTGSGCAPNSTVETGPANWNPVNTNTPSLDSAAYVGLYPGGSGLQGVNVILGPASAAAGTYASAVHLVLNNMTMQPTSSLGFGYDITLNRIEFQGDGTLNGGGLIIENGGTMLKSGGTNTYFVDGYINATNDLFEVDSGTLAFPSGFGNAQIDGATTFAISNNATLLLTVDSGAVPFLEGTVAGVGGGTVLFNNGSLDTVSGYATLNFPGNMFQWTGGTLKSAFTNSGVMNLANAPGFYGGTLYNNNLINLADKSGVYFSGPGGTIDNEAGGTFNIQGDSSFIGGGALYNYGLFTKSAGLGTSQVNSTFYNYGGTIEADTGTLDLNVNSAGYYTNVTFVVSNGATIDFITNNYNMTIEGNLTGSGGGTILMNSGTVSCNYGVSLNFPGAMFQWQGGKLGNGYGFVMTNLGTLNIGGSVGIAGLILNDGTMIESGTGAIGSGNGLYNNAGSVYEIQNDNGISIGDIYNYGLVQKSAGNGTSVVAANFYNYGPKAVLEVDSGTVALDGGNLFTNTSLVVSNGATLDLFTANNYTEIEGTWTGSGGGTVLMTNGILDSSYQATLNFPGAMFQLAGGSLGDQSTPVITNVGTINVSGPARLNNYGNIANSGMMIQSGAGTITGGVGLINNAGAVYDLQDDKGVTLANVYNDGLIKKSAGRGISQIYSINSFDSDGGRLEADSGTLALANSGYYFTNATSFVVSNGATIALKMTDNSTEVEGSLNGFGGGTVTMTNGTTIYCRSGANLNFPGSMFQWQGGYIGNTATSSPLLTNAGTLNLVGLVGLNGYLANDGTMIQSGSGALRSGGAGLRNNGLYQIQNDSGVTNGGYFANYGLLEKTAGGGTSSISGPFDNYGAIQAASGTLLFVNGEFDHYTNTLQLTPAITFGSGQNLYLRGGTITGVGTLGYTENSVYVNGGVLAPGNPFGTIYIPSGDTYLNSGGTLNIVLGGTNQFSQLAVNNHIQLGGRLNVTLTNGYTPAIGTQFQIISNGSTSSSFATVNVPNGISLTYSNSGAYLTVTSAVPPQVESPQVSSENFGFTFGTVNGQSYTIQQNTNLAMPNWTFYTNITGNGLPYQLALPVANLPGIFFRVSEP